MIRTFRPDLLHWFAWCGLLVSSLFVTILVVPGLPSAGDAKLEFPGIVERVVNQRTVSVGPPQFVREFEHGWPLTFQRRALGYTRQRNHLVWRKLPPPVAMTGTPLANTPLGGITVGDHEIAWTAPIAWQFGESDLYEFYFWPAVLDVVLLIGVVALATAGCQRWIQRRRSIWRWRLVDLAAAVGLAAISLTVWRWYATAHERDASAYPDRTNRVSSFGRPSAWQYRGPEWLARLVGGREPLRQFDRVISFHLNYGTLGEISWEEIAKLTALERLVIRHHQPSESDFEIVVELPKLKELVWHNMPAEAVLWLPRLKSIETIELIDCPLPPRTVKQLRETMPTVEIRVRPSAKFFEPVALTGVRRGTFDSSTAAEIR